MSDENVIKQDIKREWDNIKFFVTEKGKYQKINKLTGQKEGEFIETEPGIKIITPYTYAVVSPLFICSLFQALNGTDKELRDEIEKRFVVQREEIKKLIDVKF